MAKIIDVRLSGRHLNMDDLKAIRLYPEQSGFLPDEPKDNSSQYHAYMLLLIMRFADRSDLLLRRLVLKAINWMEEIWRQYGDPSPLGRGRFQLFGYASMVTCGHMAKDWGVNVDPLWVNAARVRARPETPTGAMSATWAGPFRHCLLHGYNTTDDYAAFAELWLRGIPAPDSVESMTGHVVPRSTQLWWHPVDHDGSGLVATNSGPIIALLKNHQRPPAQRPGVISFFKQLLISPFQQKKLTLTPQLIHHDKPFAVDGFVISQQTDKLVIQNNESTLNQHLVLESTTVWGKNAADKFSFSGSCEVEELTWARQSSAAWYGVCFRMARHANAALEWTV
ncbi:hypothetical protein [Aquabacterium sp.]|uniref:hypothetical protein n=1 Tax=Aquabacterium sp. TaxID=1872578 RepID=UPI0035AF7E55